MKHKLRWLLLLVPIALFAWAYQAASWRPKLVGEHPIPSTKSLFPVRAPDYELLISPNGNYLASMADMGTESSLMMWRPESRRQLWAHQEDSTRQSPLAFSPDSRTLAIAEKTFRSGLPSLINILLVDSATGKQRRLPRASWQNDLQSAAFLSAHELVASSSQYATVADVQTGKVVRRIGFDGVTFQEDPKRLLTAQSQVSADGTTVIALANGPKNTRVFIYDTQSGKERGHWTYPIIFRNPRLSPDGKLWVLTRRDEVTIMGDVYDATNGQKLWGPLIASAAGLPWIWSADGQKILFQTTARNSVAMVDARTMGHPKIVASSAHNQALALAPHGDYFYDLDDQGKIWRWRAR